MSCGTVSYAVRWVKERQAKSSLSLSCDMSDSCFMFGPWASLCACGEVIKRPVQACQDVKRVANHDRQDCCSDMSQMLHFSDVSSVPVDDVSVNDAMRRLCDFGTCY